MLTTEIVKRVAQMYKEGAPDDHAEFERTVRSSDDMADVVASLAAENLVAAAKMDTKMAIAASMVLMEIGYRLAKTEQMEEMFK